jgi:hypothetical protein
MTGVNKTLEQCEKRLVKAGVDSMSLNIDRVKEVKR